MQHTVVATQLNVKGTLWYTRGTQQLQRYTTFIHSSAQHIHDTETFRLPKRQVASTMISVLAL